MSLTKRLGALLGSVGLAVTGTVVLAPTPPAVAAAKPANNTAANVLVVNANLAELLNSRDVVEPRELPTFVNKLVAQTKVAPDVVALQEVNPFAAQNVADRLTQATEGTYRVAYGSGYAQQNWTPAKADGLAGNGAALVGIKGDGYWGSAVVINTETVSKVANTERRITFNLTSAYRSPAKAKSGTDFANQSSGVMVRKKASGTKYYVHSVHFPPAKELKDSEGGNGPKFQGKLTAWTNKLVESATKQGAVPVLVGDFNWGLTKIVTKNGKEIKVDSNMWAILKKHGYRAAFPTGWSIEHIFSTRAISGARRDSGYLENSVSKDAFTLCKVRHDGGEFKGKEYKGGQGAAGSAACKAGYYSDHDFTFARVS